LEAVRAVVAETGVLSGRRRRVFDSTVLADAVATQDTVTQLVAAIPRVGRQVPGAATRIAMECRAHDYSVPGKPKIDWDVPEARDALVSALVTDALHLVEVFTDPGYKLSDRQAAAVTLLALVAGQDVEPAEGSDGTDGRWRIARKVAENRVISTVDPETRHTPQVLGGAPGRLPLPGWSRGHVLTHLARNADGGRRLLVWARTGVESFEYASLQAGRRRSRRVPAAALGSFSRTCGRAPNGSPPSTS
jgi:hypothetical protein